MSFDSNSFLDTDDFNSFSGSLKTPPKILFILGLVSVCSGILVGLLGFISASGSTNSQQFFIGVVGYLLTALIPIVLLQIIRAKHSKLLQENSDYPYDVYAGIQLQSKILKVVLIGLISAALPIYVFFLPIAEKLVA